MEARVAPHTYPIFSLAGGTPNTCHSFQPLASVGGASADSRHLGSLDIFPVQQVIITFNARGHVSPPYWLLSFIFNFA